MMTTPGAQGPHVASALPGVAEVTASRGKVHCVPSDLDLVNQFEQGCNFRIVNLYTSDNTLQGLAR
jgi:hypothetical protein